MQSIIFITACMAFYVPLPHSPPYDCRICLCKSDQSGRFVSLMMMLMSALCLHHFSLPNINRNKRYWGGGGKRWKRSHSLIIRFTFGSLALPISSHTSYLCIHIETLTHWVLFIFNQIHRHSIECSLSPDLFVSFTHSIRDSSTASSQGLFILPHGQLFECTYSQIHSQFASIYIPNVWQSG